MSDFVDFAASGVDLSSEWMLKLYRKFCAHLFNFGLKHWFDLYVIHLYESITKKVFFFLKKWWNSRALRKLGILRCRRWDFPFKMTEGWSQGDTTLTAKQTDRRPKMQIKGWKTDSANRPTYRQGLQPLFVELSLLTRHPEGRGRREEKTRWDLERRRTLSRRREKGGRQRVEGARSIQRRSFSNNPTGAAAGSRDLSLSGHVAHTRHSAFSALSVCHPLFFL